MLALPFSVYYVHFSFRDQPVLCDRTNRTEARKVIVSKRMLTQTHTHPNTYAHQYNSMQTHTHTYIHTYIILSNSATTSTNTCYIHAKGTLIKKEKWWIPRIVFMWNGNVELKVPIYL